MNRLHLGGYMSLAEATKNLKFDKRLSEVNLNLGIITADELKKQKESLPDLAHNVATIELEKAEEAGELN